MLQALLFWWQNPNIAIPPRACAFNEVDLFNRALAEIADYRVTLEAAVLIDSATASRPINVEARGHGYATGDRIIITGFREMAEVNDRVFSVTVTGTDSFQLDREDGLEYRVELSGGEARRLSTGRHVGAVFDVWPSLRAEVLQMHSWNEATTYKRLARLEAVRTITGITNANVAVVTTDGAHGYVLGDQLRVDEVVGMLELNGRFFDVGAVTTNTFELAGEDSSTYATYSSGGTAEKALTPLRPDFGYTFKYDLPTDALRVLNIADIQLEDSSWERRGMEFLTDIGDTVQIRYTRCLITPADYGAQLFAAFAARLAWEIAPQLADSTSREERAERRWLRMAAMAKRMDGTEQSAAELSDSRWLRARRGERGEHWTRWWG